MQLVSTVVVGSGGGVIEWTNIPQTGKDIVILLSGRDNTATANVFIALNGSISNLTGRQLRGDGSSATGNTVNDNLIGISTGSGRTANTFGSLYLYLPNYTATGNKTLMVDSVEENNATTALMRLHTGLRANTAAITSIQLAAQDVFVENSSASLYLIS